MLTAVFLAAITSATTKAQEVTSTQQESRSKNDSLSGTSDTTTAWQQPIAVVRHHGFFRFFRIFGRHRATPIPPGGQTFGPRNNGQGGNTEPPKAATNFGPRTQGFGGTLRSTTHSAHS